MIFTIWGSCIFKRMEKFMEKAVEKVVDLSLSLGTTYFDLGNNLQLLENYLQALTCKASDIEDEVTNAERSGAKKRKREVENWLENVKKVKEEVTALKNRLQEVPSWRDPLRGDRVKELQKRVSLLLQQPQHFNGLLLDVFESKGTARIVDKLFGGMFKKNLEKILQYLVTDKISSTGIYGMGGVGKTALAKHIHNHLLERTDFRVHWVTVSQEFSLKRLQKDIAKIIGLELSDNDDKGSRATKLSRELMEQKNLVIIFDDVWKDLNLREVGVPHGSERCRVILTTRSLEVCNRMRCERKIQVNTLDTDEAWELFQYVLGDETLLPADVKDVAMTVARRCAGLPLGIITVAGSMRGVADIREWRNTLEQLNALSAGHEEMELNVFPLLELSFSRLKKCERLCLLYCCLYEEDQFIHRVELIRRFISAGFMDKRKSRKQEFDQGHTVINKLLNVCLLEKAGEDFVKMHDLIRDMALRITSGRSNLMVLEDMPKFMVKAGVGLNEMRDEKEWTADLDAVSILSDEEMSKISPNTSPKCPNLSTLILNWTSLRSIPDSFFVHMSGLKVLDLSYTGIEQLPSCVAHMEKLTTLLLYGCQRLYYVPPLVKLKELRELDLGITGIEEVPQSLEMLTNLKFLNMAGSLIEKIPTGALSHLSHLQSLCISSFIQSDKDVRGLKHLEEFFGGILDIAVYNEFMRSCNGSLDSCYIIVNEFADDELEYHFGEMGYIGLDFDAGVKILRLKNCTFGNSEILLPRDIENLSIWNCSGRGSCLSDVFSRWNSCTRNLLELQLELLDIEFLFRVSTSDEQQDSSCVPLLRLKTLSLEELENLVGLIKLEPEAAGPGCLSSGTFSLLRELRISSCEKLKTIFTLPLLQNLQNLVELYVGNCEMLEEITLSADSETEGGVEGISISSRSTTDVILPKLEELKLDDLPELKSIYNGTMICDSLLNIDIEECPKLRRLPFSLSSVQSLEHVCGSEKEWWESLEWDNPSAKNALDQKFGDGRNEPDDFE